MTRDTLKSATVLTCAALVWGMGFVAQRYGMNHVGPFFFAGTRMLFAALTMLLVIAITGSVAKRRPAEGDALRDKGIFKEFLAVPVLLKGGVVCGLVLSIAQGLQQVGMVFTTASKAGFLTTLYIVVVPIIGIFLKKHTHWNTWVSVLIAASGLYFLSITSTFTISPGDLVLLISAVMWAAHIIVTGHYVASLDRQGVFRLVTVQFLTCSAFSFILSPFIDRMFDPAPLTADVFVQVLPALLYSGCVSASVGFTLQAIGQRRISPSAAGIILSIEAVFGAVFGALILGERLSSRELLGCVFMFAAVVLSQIPVKEKKRSK
ncbi:MAG: DMT family transporter [Clostridiales Family XIII bacterium]|jgi:drug/metabolite transporter (DMT)-like permease|nr:DMT family transporter [Clostridiales Family XIII bacterium]